MKQGRILGILGIAIVISSILKLTGWHHNLTNGYERIATTIMTWIAPEIFTSVYPSSIKALAIYIPIVFAFCLSLFIIHLVKYHRAKSKARILA